METTKISRQAVIIIHGIGEQKPMDTLREFVKEVAPEIPNSDKQKSFNKPDIFSDLFELRRMTASRHKLTFKTDYFEYYWAHNMQDNKISDVFWWIFSLIFRPFYTHRKLFSINEIPQRIRFVFYGLWLIALTFLVLFCLGIYDRYTHGKLFDQYLTWFSGYFIKIIIGLFLSGIGYILASYLGDVARYMTPKAHNIGNREIIRKNAFLLLDKLHTMREGDKNVYDRIVIIGHSLGSVIAYDVINLYWNHIHKYTDKIDPVFILEQEKIALALIEIYTNLPKKPSAEEQENYQNALKLFQNAQFNLWKSQYQNECSWRISDFITLGSPLANANLFLAKNNETFEEKKVERELPTSPPAFEFFEYKNELNENVKKQHCSFPHGNKQKADFPLMLHHAAAFSMTRWVNIYFKNDFVGGKIECLGGGIENIPALIPEKKWLGFITFRATIPFLSHIYYWNKNEKKSIGLIREKLRLMFR